MSKTKKPKPGFMDCYNRPDRQYDSRVAGHGNCHQWKAAFDERMGWKEASQTIGTDDPFEILGIKKNASKVEIKTAFNKWALKWHPDKWPVDQYNKEEIDRAEKMFIRGLAAYTLLKEG